MKRLSSKGFHRVRPRCIRGHTPTTAVNGVANQSMPDMCHMDPDLMGPPRLKPAMNHGCMGAECFNIADPRHCMPPTLKQNGLFLSVCPVPCQLCGDLDRPSGFETDTANTLQTRITNVRQTMTEGDIQPLDTMFGKLIGQPMVRCIRFRHDKQTRRIFVDPVHDAGAFFTANSRQIAAEMVQKRIDQRPRRRSGGRVDDHARRFVDDDQVFIFVQNGQRNVFGQSVSLNSVLDRDAENIAFFHLGLGIRHNHVCARNRTIRQEPRKPRPA